MATFGKTTDGTGQSQSSTDRKKVSSASPSTSGTATSITIRGRVGATSTVIKGVIYSDNAGAPDALLAVSDEIAVNSTTEQNWTGALSGGNQISITSGTTYWIGWIQQDPGAGASDYFEISRDGTASMSQTNTDTYSDGPTNPFGTPTAESGPVDVFVTYTEGPAVGPVVRSVTSAAEANTPDVSVTKPAGLAVGDYLLVFQMSDADGTLAAMTAPSGFTELGSQAPTQATNIPPAKVWGKVAVQADVDATTFAFPDSTGAHSTVVLVAIQTGTYDAATPISTPVCGSQGSASDANVIAPSITGVTNALLVTGYLSDTGGVVRTFSSGPAGMTLTHQSAAGNSTYTRIGVYQQTLASGGATGTKTAVLSGSPDGWTTTALLVNPASGVNIARRTGGFLQLL